MMFEVENTQADQNDVESKKTQYDSKVKNIIAFALNLHEFFIFFNAIMPRRWEKS